MVSNQKNHLFLEKTKKTIFWRPQPHSFGKDGFFGFFGFLVFLVFLVFLIFLVCWFLLVSCFVVVFCLDLARTRLPSAVGPLGGGGVSIYIYVCIQHMYICIYMLIYKLCAHMGSLGCLPRNLPSLAK